MTTIIRVIYVECISINDDTECSEAFIEREMLVNLNCPIKMVLDYIRKVALPDKAREFDLCDEITCQLKNVSLYEPRTRGTDILQPDVTYFIIVFERDGSGQMINLTPLLTGKTAKKYCDMLAKTRRPLRKAASVKSVLKKNNNNA